jgi:hypothetical protein
MRVMQKVFLEAQGRSFLFEQMPAEGISLPQARRGGVMTKRFSIMVRQWGCQFETEFCQVDSNPESLAWAIAQKFSQRFSLVHIVDNTRRRKKKPQPSLLSELKAAMAAAHPDRGGSSEAFIAARARYVAARRSLQSSP